MRAFDVAGIGLALILVPLVAWWVGRVGGRRDWRISSLLLISLLVSLAIQIDILALLAANEGRLLPFVLEDFLLRLGRRITEAGASPEFSVFLLILGCFIGMLGWSSVSARKTA